MTEPASPEFVAAFQFWFSLGWVTFCFLMVGWVLWLTTGKRAEPPEEPPTPPGELPDPGRKTFRA